MLLFLSLVGFLKGLPIGFIEFVLLFSLKARGPLLTLVLLTEFPCVFSLYPCLLFNLGRLDSLKLLALEVYIELFRLRSSLRSFAETINLSLVS
jgi:hypothetical protein